MGVRHGENFKPRTRTVRDGQTLEMMSEVQFLSESAVSKILRVSTFLIYA